jgi:hypothetical protein
MTHAITSCCSPHDLLHVPMVHSCAQALPANYSACRYTQKTAQHREVPTRMASSACQASRFSCRWLLQLLLRMLRHEDICEQCHCVCCCDTKSVDSCNAHALPASRHIAAAAGGGTGAQCAHLCLCTLGTRLALQAPNLP